MLEIKGSKENFVVNSTYICGYHLHFGAENIGDEKVECCWLIINLPHTDYWITFYTKDYPQMYKYYEGLKGE